MTINDAVETVERFLDRYGNQHDDWNPTEIRVLPSGDDMDAIKVMVNFGPDVADGDLPPLRDRIVKALKADHAELMSDFKVEIRAIND